MGVASDRPASVFVSSARQTPTSEQRGPLRLSTKGGGGVSSRATTLSCCISSSVRAMSSAENGTVRRSLVSAK